MGDTSKNDKRVRAVIGRITEDLAFLHLVKVNHEVNHGIMAYDWLNAWLTSWLTLTMCRKDRPVLV